MMYNDNNGKLKDARPVDTIQRIREIISDMDILLTEKWFESVNGIFSVMLQSVQTRFSTNGKGTSQQYALASGYGEFIERLQNGVLYMYKMELSKEDTFYDGFVYAPDEKVISFEDALSSEFISVLDSLGNQSGKTDIEMLCEWERIQDYHTEKNELICLPFYDAKGKKIKYIPVSILFMKYGTNGMCAGNTPEEAMVQGLSEIIERYVNFRIIDEKITPPTIPDNIIEKYPSLLKMKTEIEKSGNYKVILKDCSLGENWLVVCMILIDQKKQTYFVKFASHPYWPIAIERTLTELLQGRNIHSMVGMTEFHMTTRDNIHPEGNKLNIAATGGGFYPLSLFEGKESYTFSDALYSIHENKTPSNAKMLAELIQKLFDEGYNLLVRDVSFLGFPSFYLLVPGMSEITMDNEYAIDTAYDRRFIANTCRNIKNASKQELESLICKMDSSGWKPEAIMSFALKLKMRKEFNWNRLHYGIFKTNILLELKKYEEAIALLNDYVSFLKNQGVDSGRLSYYRCIICTMEVLNEGLPQEEAYQSLSSFFPEKLLAESIDVVNKPLESMEPLPCFRCEVCTHTDDCLYKDISKFHRRWKDKYKEHELDQRDVQKIIARIMPKL